MSTLQIAFLLFGIVNGALFGSSRQTYKEGAQLNMKVNGLSSTKTHIPYEYYYLPFPKPEVTIHKSSSLGEILTANHIENSVFDVNVLSDVTCAVVGEKDYSEADVQKFVRFIDDEYLAEILVDNLPAVMNIRLDDNSIYYERGYPIGGLLVKKDSSEPLGHAINNHLDFTIMYNEESKTGFEIVGFEVSPRSIFYADKDSVSVECSKPHSPSMIIEGDGVRKTDKGVHVLFTYSVKWVRSQDSWSHRFDHYSNSEFSQETRPIHLYSLVNSLLVVLFLTGMVAFIVYNTVFQDFALYSRLPTDDADDADVEDSGWKVLHADVFRAPERSLLLLTALAGSGVQLLGVVLLTAVAALFGCFSPERRGDLIDTMMLFYVLASFAGGFTAVWLYISFGGKHVKRLIVLTASLLPCTVLGLYSLQNILAASYRSTTAVPLLSILKIVAIWVGVSLPLVVLGAFRGMKKEPFEPPVATSAIPREIPPQPWYVRSVPMILIGGLVPFGVVFVELYFCLASVWMGFGYSMYGFLGAVLLILLVTTAEIAIILTYSMLCSENYNWWWMSFLAPASSGIYAFAFSFYYLVTTFKISNVLVLVETVGYLLILSTVFSLLTGCVGFIASFTFVKALYGSVKVD